MKIPRKPKVPKYDRFSAPNRNVPGTWNTRAGRAHDAMAEAEDAAAERFALQQQAKAPAAPAPIPQAPPVIPPEVKSMLPTQTQYPMKGNQYLFPFMQ